MGSLSWYGAETVAVVTGGNKGIGLEIVRGLARSGVTTVLTARDAQKGQSALEKLKEEGLQRVVFHPLEVQDAKSAVDLGEWLHKTYGGFDILINNAGVLYNHCDYPTARQTLDINYYGTKSVTSGLLQFAKHTPHGVRIVNVASELGALSYFPDNSPLKAKFKDATDVAQIDALVEKFVEDVKQDRWQQEGWPTKYHSYSVSKIAELAYSRILAQELQKPGSEQTVFVNAMTPGYCATDMTKYMGYRTAVQGADTAVWLALLPRDQLPCGKFFFDREESSY